ncbi:hypothetical protein SESBI_38549, partial [Sesbania bispinosa]
MGSITKAPSSSEESGWTKYFEDFFNNHNIDDKKCSISFSGVDYSSSSLVSDAAKKLADNAQAYRNTSSFQKRKKIKTTLVDDDLEDTASSPINSPKVLDENQTYKAKQKEIIDFYQ